MRKKKPLKPCVIANSDRIGRLYGVAPVEIVHRMLWREQLAVGPNEHMVANGDVGATKKCAVVVDEHMFTDMIAAGVITEKWRTDLRGIRNARCHLPQQRPVIGRCQSGLIKR